MTSSKRLLIGALSVAFSVGLVAWLLARLDWAEVRLLLAQARLGWLLVAALLTFTMPLSSVVRWRGVLRAQPGPELPFSLSLRAVLMANVLNSFLPSKAGDVAKAAYLRRHGGVAHGLGTVLLERLVDLTVLGVLALVGALQTKVVWGFVTSAALLGGVGAVLLFVLVLPSLRLGLPERLVAALGAIREVMTRWRASPPAVAQTLLGSLLTWLAGGLTVYALAQALQANLGAALVYSVFPLAILAGLVPLTVSGIGTRDAAFVALLSPHSSPELATLIGLGYTLFAYWLLSLISLPVIGWELAALRQRPPTPRTDAPPPPAGS